MNKTIVKNKHSNKYELFDKTHFGIVKGIGIFIVVLVHLTNRYLNFPYLSPIAGAAVSIFLLCSGYGLSESFKYKGLKNYWSNKLVKIWLPSFIQICLFAVIGMIGVKAWLMDYPLFLYGWYLQVLFFDYALFWLVYRFIKNQKMCLIFIFVISIITFLLLKSQIHAEQLLCFPIGVAVSQLNLKSKIENMSTFKFVTVIAILGVIVVGAFLCRNVFEHYILFNFVWLLFKMFSAILVVLGTYVLRKVIIMKLFVSIGSISYSLYLLNNYTLSILDGKEIGLINLSLALVLTVVSAVVYTKVCDLIFNQYIKLKSKGKKV